MKKRISKFSTKIQTINKVWNSDKISDYKSIRNIKRVHIDISDNLICTANLKDKLVA